MSQVVKLPKIGLPEDLVEEGQRLMKLAPLRHYKPGPITQDMIADVTLPREREIEKLPPFTNEEKWLDYMKRSKKAIVDGLQVKKHYEKMERAYIMKERDMLKIEAKIQDLKIKQKREQFVQEYKNTQTDIGKIIRVQREKRVQDQAAKIQAVKTESYAKRQVFQPKWDELRVTGLPVKLYPKFNENPKTTKRPQFCINK